MKLKVLTLEVRVELSNGDGYIADWFFPEEFQKADRLYNRLCNNPPENATSIELWEHLKPIKRYQVG